MKKYCELVPQDVVGATWGVSKIVTKDELIAIGKNNLNHLLQTYLKYDVVASTNLSQISPDHEKYGNILEMKRDMSARVTYLFDLMDDAEEKPYIPSFRPKDWFSANDRVMVFIKDIEKVFPKYDNTFISCTVVEFIKDENIVVVRADTPLHDGDYLDGYGLTVGPKIPEILQMWEYDYLREHPDFLEIWLRRIKEDRDGKNFDSEQFTAALKA